jgi:hypothetical protein
MVAAMMMVVMMPVPPMMMMAPPVNFRRRQPGIFLNGGSGAGIAERKRAGALGRRSEHEQGAYRSQSQNFGELHEISPSNVTSAPNGSPQRCTQSAACDLNES